jgi:hypothetical protein
MDKATILASLEFSRGRLLGILEAIEKSGQDMNKVLAWRPGPGRAHIGWQAMHCAATHDRYLHMGLLGGAAPTDPRLVADFAGGSTPSDANVPMLAAIREELAKHYAKLRTYVESLSNGDLDRRLMMGKVERGVGESLILIAWHEAHHQGQIHLTWNQYKGAHGIA